MIQSDNENKIYSGGKETRMNIEEKVALSFIPDGSSILDVGCGTGEISAYLKSKGSRTVGVDFSIEAVKKARKKGFPVLNLNVDIGLPFKDRQFDYAIAFDVLEHVFDPMGLIKEMRRVARRSIFIIPNEFSLAHRARLLFNPMQYREYVDKGVSKHHTLFSWSLVKLLFDNNITKTVFVCRIPKTNIKFISKSAFIGNMFADCFVFIAN